MMILCDCITQDLNDQSELFKYIEHLSEIIEIKAITVKDLSDYGIKPSKNNL